MDQYGRLLRYIDSIIPNFDLKPFKNQALFQKLVYLGESVANFNFGTFFKYEWIHQTVFSEEVISYGQSVLQMLSDYPEAPRNVFYADITPEDTEKIQLVTTILKNIGFKPDQDWNATFLQNLDFLITLHFLLNSRVITHERANRLREVISFLKETTPVLKTQVADQQMLDRHLGLLGKYGGLDTQDFRSSPLVNV